MTHKQEKLDKPKNDNVVIREIDESDYVTLEERILRTPRKRRE